MRTRTVPGTRSGTSSSTTATLRGPVKLTTTGRAAGATIVGRRPGGDAVVIGAESRAAATGTPTIRLPLGGSTSCPSIDRLDDNFTASSNRFMHDSAT